jgi:hypothetical protein
VSIRRRGARDPTDNDDPDGCAGATPAHPFGFVLTNVNDGCIYARADAAARWSVLPQRRAVVGN